MADDPEGMQLYIDDSGYFTVKEVAVRRLISLLLLDETLGFMNAYPKIRVGERPHLLGFEWDLSEPSVGLPLEKRDRLLSEIDILLSSHASTGKVEIARVKSLAGKLSWLCHVCRALRPCLTNVYATMASADTLRKQYPYMKHIPLAKAAIPDLEIFRTAIAYGDAGTSENNGGYLSRIPATFLIGYSLDEDFDVDRVTVCVSDACCTGIAGTVITGGRAYWFMMQLPDPLNSPLSDLIQPANAVKWSHRDMAPLELLACYCCCLLAPNDRPAIFLCDNKACVDSLNALSCKSPRMKAVMLQISRAWRYGRGLRAFHLDSKSNWLADDLSRMHSPQQAREYMKGSTMTEVDMALLLQSLPR